jgi:choline-phosphate cytidylyltransferase
MKKVITYGTYDLFHEGHDQLLKRAKQLGDYLIVGVTTESYDNSRGKLNVQQSLMKRIENIRNSGLADEIILEEFEGQKINDIQKYDVNVFAIGSDWLGKFDYLKEYCDVVYLERTKGISSTKLRAENNGTLKLGIVGCGGIAKRFIIESKFVSGVNVEGVFGRNQDSLRQFVKEQELAFFSLSFNEFLDKIDAIYIASPYGTHYDYIKRALEKGRHVLCEKPMVLSVREIDELYKLAQSKKCVLLEAIETAYSLGFIRLISVAKSGLIGKIKNIDITFTKLAEDNMPELDITAAGGSVIELASYPLMAIIKILGESIETAGFYSYYDSNKEVDMFTKINLKYKDAIATAKVGIGVESEGDLVISGTKGYVYVPSPWWKAEYFETRFENIANNKKHYYKFEGDGLRYELAEFISIINKKELTTYKLTQSESSEIIKIIEKFRGREDVYYI